MKSAYYKERSENKRDYSAKLDRSLVSSPNCGCLCLIISTPWRLADTHHSELQRSAVHWTRQRQTSPSFVFCPCTMLLSSPENIALLVVLACCATFWSTRSLFYGNVFVYICVCFRSKHGAGKIEIKCRRVRGIKLLTAFGRECTKHIQISCVTGSSVLSHTTLM